MPTTNLRNLVYFPSGPDNVDSDLQALASDQYISNVVLGQFHFDKTDGTLSWNDTPISQVPSSVWTLVQALCTGSYPKVVSLQIGSAGNGTWSWIANDMNAAAQSLFDVVSDPTYGIQGIDLDPEPVGEVQLQTILDFTVLLGGMKSQSSFYLSHVPVPFDSVYFPQLYKPSNWAQMESYVDWITPQWYGEVGSTLVSSYESFVAGSQTGQPLPADKVVGGQNTSDTSLDSLTSAITSLRSSYGSDWGGVGLWAYPYPDSSWGQSIYDALNGI